MGSPERELCPPPSEEDELTLPRASINKMIKELVPSVRVAFESRELILNCCTEFIHLISSEANEVCNQSNKKTINAEHVLTALDRLGFSDYTVEAEAVLKDCKAVAAKRRRQSTRLENLGIPEEELLRQQQELFAKKTVEENKKNEKPSKPQCSLAAKDSEWVDILQTSSSKINSTKNNDDKEVEPEGGTQINPLALMFPGLIESDPEMLEEILNKVMSTTEVTKHLVGHKANFAVMKKVNRLIPTDKKWLESVTENISSCCSVESKFEDDGLSHSEEEGDKNPDV